MIVAAPTWFNDEYLGIEIEQYIGFGLLAVIITIVHFALLRLIDIFVRRRYASSDLTFWDAERRRLNRGILLLTIGITLLLGFPILDFDVEIDDVVNQVATLVAAVGVLQVAYRAIDIFMDILAKRASETESKLDDSLVPLLRTACLLYTSPSPRDATLSRMPSSA